MWRWKPCLCFCFPWEQRPLLGCRCKCTANFYPHRQIFSLALSSFFFPLVLHWHSEKIHKKPCVLTKSWWVIFLACMGPKVRSKLSLNSRMCCDCFQEPFLPATITTIRPVCTSPHLCSCRSYGRSSKQAWSLTCSRSSEWALLTG